MANSKGGNIEFGIGFKVDKSGLKDIESSLRNLVKATPQDLFGAAASSKDAKQAMSDIREQAAHVKKALEDAYNPTLGTLNIDKFNKSLQGSETSLNQVYQAFSKAGKQGNQTFNSIAREVLTTNVKLKQTHSLLDSMGTTMINTIKWSAASTIMNAFTGSISNAYNYVKALDGSLTDIRIVTGYSKDQMNQFADSANKAAQALGRQTKEYTNAALTFYQQGLSDEEVQVRTETTLKAANITGAEASSVADQLTAVWNGFQVSLEDTEDVVSKMAAVADSSASNMSELATAMSKVASVANNMGVDVDQLNAQIATIIATTRQAPQTVGNALKTIYARINDIKTGTDEAEMSLGNYTGKMAELGINVLDSNGRLRDTGDVMEQIGERWSTMTREQQIYLTQTMAGQRQMNNLMALFEHWDMYTKELNVSLQAQGTLDQKNAIAMESLAAHTRQLEAASEGLIQAFVNGDSFIGIIDVGTNILNLFTQIIEAVGGGGNAILTLGGIFTQVFSKQIGKELNSFITNFQNMAFNQKQLDTLAQSARDMAQINDIKDDKAIQKMIDRQQAMKDIYNIMSQAEINHYNQLVKEQGKANDRLQTLEKEEEEARNTAAALLELSEAEKKTLNFQTGEGLGEVFTKIQKLQSSFTKIQERIESFKEKISSSNKRGANSIFNALMQELEQLAQKTGYTTEEIKNFKESLKGKPYDQQIKIIEQEFGNIQKRVENVNKTISDGGKSYNEARRDAEAYGRTVDEVEKKHKQAFNAQTISKFISGVTALIGTFKSLGEVASTWADDSVSDSEKLSKTLSAMALIIPGLISGFQGIVSALKLIEITGTAAFAWAGGIILALTAITTIYATVKKNQQEVQENIRKEAEERIEYAKTLEKERQENSKLEDSYLEVYTRYKQGKASKQEMLEATENLNDIYDNELLALAKLTGNYDLFTQALKRNREERLKNAEAATEQAKRSLFTKASGTLEKAGIVGTEGYNIIEATSNLRLSPRSDTELKIQNIVKSLQEDFSFLSYDDDLNEIILDYGTLNQETIPKIYEQISKVLSLASKGEYDVNDMLYKRLDSIQSALKDYYNEYDQIINDAKQQNVSKVINQVSLQEATSFQDYLNKRAEIEKQLTDAYEQEEAIELLQRYAATFSGAVQNFEQRTLALNGFLKDVAKNQQEDLREYLIGLSQEQFEIAVSFDGTKTAENISAFLVDVEKDRKKAAQKVAQELGRSIVSQLSENNFETLDEKSTEDLLELIDATQGLEEAKKEALKAIVTSNKAQKEKIDDLQKELDLNLDITKSAKELRNEYIEQQKAAKNARLEQAKDDKAEKQARAENLQYYLNLSQDDFDKYAASQHTDPKELRQRYEEYISQYNSAIQLLDAEIDSLRTELTSIENENQINSEWLKEFVATTDATIQNLYDLNSSRISIYEKAIEALQENEGFNADQLAALYQAGYDQIYKETQFDNDTGVFKFIDDEDGQKAQKYIEELTTLTNNARQESINGLNKQNEILQQQIDLLKEKGQNTDQYTAKIADNERKISEITAQAFDATHIKTQMKEAEDSAFNLEEALKDIFDGKFLEGTDWEEFQNILNELQQSTPELTAQIELLKQSALQGTEIYLTALSQIQEKINEIKLDNLIEQSNKASDSFKESFDALFQDSDQLKENLSNATALDFEQSAQELLEYQQNVDAFMTRLSEYTSAQYAIDIEVHTQAEQAFDQINDLLQGLEDAGNKIGQNFIVAGSDLRELNNAFPGILEGMQVLADGTYQLNEDIAQSAIESATAQAAARAESIRSQLEDQSKLLHKKAQIYTKMANAAAVLAQSQVHSEEEADQARATLSAGLAELQQTNSELASNQAMLNQQAVANSAMANGQAMAVNWRNAAQSAAQSIYQFALNACANMAEVAKGEDGKPTLPNISSSFSGMSGVSMEASAVSSAQDAIEGQYEQDFAALEQQFRALAEMSEASANDIDGMLAEIGANANSIADGVRNIGEGRKWGDNGIDSGKKSGGGGGGGGKDKSKSADQIQDMKLKNEQIDLYHELDRAIKATQETLDDYDKAKKKTVRNGLAQTIDNQIEALEKQKGLYEQKIGMMQAQLQAQQANLAALGVQFDEQGNIINYTGLMIEYQNLYNSLLEEAKFLTGDAQEGKLRQAEAVKAKLDALRSQMGAYEALQDKITEAGNAIEDILDKEEELRIQKFKINIDVQLDFAEAERDWNEFRKKVIDQIKDDDYVGQATARLADFDSYYKPDGGGIIQELTEHVNRTREEAEIIQNGGTSQIYGRNEAQALEDLKHYTDELMQNLEDVQQIAKDIHDLFLDTIDKAQDAFDDQIGQYEQIAKLIEHDMNLIQLRTPNNNEDALNHYYELMHKNNLQQIDFYRKQVDMWKEMMDAAEEGSQEWKKFRDNWENSLNDMNAAVQAAVENLIDKYHNTVDKIIRQTKDNLMGGDWQAALDEWDIAKWRDDRYLDVASRGTAMLDYTDAIKQAMQGQSPKVQQRLNKLLQSELDYLGNIKNLRQVNLDIAYKELQIEQKRIALEQAQQSKTQMRLRRDSQGNYTYQFVANEDDINQKQQQLRDAIEELRQLAKTDVTEGVDLAIEKITEFFDKAKELAYEYQDNEELAKEKILELYDTYFNPEEGLVTQIAIDYGISQQKLIEATGLEFAQILTDANGDYEAFSELILGKTNKNKDQILNSIKALIDPDGDGQLPTLLDTFREKSYEKNLKNMSNYLQGFLFNDKTGLAPSWGTAIGKVMDNLSTLANDHKTKAEEIILPAIKEIIEANRIYGEDLRTIDQIAGIVYTDIFYGTDANIAATKQLVLDNGQLISVYRQEVEAAAAVNQAIKDLVSQYNAAEQAAIAAATAAHNFWMAALGYGVDLSSPDTTSGNAHASSPGARNSSNGSSGGSGSGGSGGSNSGGGHRTYGSSSSGRATNPNSMVLFDTGGYTGSWQDDYNNGKLAVLHEKELVLNQNDTSNILSAVDIVRGLVNKVAGINDSLLSDLTGNVFNSQNISNSNDNSMNQNIVINADFPGVSDALEIKNAFDNLMNIASQYANGNRRTY